jgi:hypothetical protein
MMSISSTGLMIAKAGIAGHMAVVLLFFAPFSLISGLLTVVIPQIDSGIIGIILIVLGVVFFLVAAALGVYIYKTISQKTQDTQAGVVHVSKE